MGEIRGAPVGLKPQYRSCGLHGRRIRLDVIALALRVYDCTRLSTYLLLSIGIHVANATGDGAPWQNWFAALASNCPRL